MRRPVWLFALLAASLACSTLFPGTAPTPTQPLRVSATQTPGVLATETLRVSATQPPRVSNTQTLRVSASQTPAVSPTQTLRVSATQTPRVSETPGISTGTPAKGQPGTAVVRVVRVCDFVPGVSAAAQMPASLRTEGTPTPEPPPPLPTNTPVDAATTTPP